MRIIDDILPLRSKKNHAVFDEVSRCLNRLEYVTTVEVSKGVDETTQEIRKIFRKLNEMDVIEEQGKVERAKKYGKGKKFNGIYVRHKVAVEFMDKLKKEDVRVKLE